MIEGPATRVMCLRDGTKKMSKSDPSDMSRINLTDDADTIAAKIRKARTDPEPLPETVEGLPAGPEAANLVNIYAALAGLGRRGGARRVRRPALLRVQAGLADLAVAELAPITARMAELTADPAEIDRLLARGAERAAAIAEPILARTYEIVGLARSADPRPATR